MQLKLQQPTTLAELAAKIGVELAGNAIVVANTKVSYIAKLETAGPGSISFLANPLYKKYLPTTNASAVILTQADAESCLAPVLITKNPRLALAKLLGLCVPAQNLGEIQSNIHPSAVIGKNVALGANVKIGANCYVGDNSVIGDNSTLKPNVVLYHGVTLGKRCTIHSGTVIGSDGFGYAIDEQNNWVKMPHLGGVVIGDDVEIGSNTTIDRGMIDNTEIGNTVIIDNLVQIGHNVIIGNNTAIAGCVGIAGSAIIGKYCLIGGASSIAGHITITDNVHITATSAVSGSITKAGVYSSGLPARENGDWRRSVARFMTIDSMAKRIRNLEKMMVIKE